MGLAEGRRRQRPASLPRPLPPTASILRFPAVSSSQLNPIPKTDIIKYCQQYEKGQVNILKDETIAKVEQELDGWEYLSELPETWHGFTKRLIHKPIEDCYDIFAYESAALHKSATAYFHEETHEYKLRIKIGLIELCRIEFITADFSVFEHLLRTQLEQLLCDLAVFNPKSISSIVRDKEVLTWEAGRELPEELEGFTLFIRPEYPFKINNGSYIIIDYVDFSLESNVTFYYNIYRDEFFSEARIWNIPDVNYDFDSNTLPELEEKMQRYLVPRLQEVRRRAEKEAAERAAREARRQTEAKQEEAEPQEEV